MKVVTVAVLLALCGCAGPGKSPAAAPDGITVRFTADKRVWTEGDDPRFTVVVRNGSTRELLTALLCSLALEVDGKTFGPKAWGRSGVIERRAFGPGTEYTFPVQLGQFDSFRWSEEKDEGGATLQVGKHSIKAALLDNVREDGINTSLAGYPNMVLAFSGPLNIEVIAETGDNRSK